MLPSGIRSIIKSATVWIVKKKTVTNNNDKIILNVEDLERGYYLVKLFNKQTVYNSSFFVKIK